MCLELISFYPLLKCLTYLLNYRDAFAEMLEFEEILQSVKANSDSTSDREAKIEKKTSGRDLYFRDLCEFFDL